MRRQAKVSVAEKQGFSEEPHDPSIDKPDPGKSNTAAHEPLAAEVEQLARFGTCMGLLALNVTAWLHVRVIVSEQSVEMWYSKCQVSPSQ